MNKSKIFAITILSSLLCACQSNPSSSSSTSSSQASSLAKVEPTSSQAESVASEVPTTEESLSTPSTLPVKEEHEYTVLEAIQNGEQLAQQSSSITVIGYLPQAANVDENGNYFMVILNSTDSNTPQDRLRLEGSLDFGGCKARITGSFFYNNIGEPSLQILEAEQIPE